MSLHGLVADYGSESDSSSEEVITTEGTASTQTINHAKSNTGRNLLEAEDSSSDEDEDGEAEVSAEGSAGASVKKLPNPLLHNPLASEAEGANGCEAPDSAKFLVFTNQYREAEKAKDSILEKHVKMTVSLAAAKGRKRQICFKFQKGKCRFGKSCKYSHDLDTVSVPEASQKDDNVAHSRNFVNPNSSNFAAMTYDSKQNWHVEEFQDEKDDDSYMANMRRKRRAGINDTLLPSKKALMPLEKQRAVERPWTLTDDH